MNFRGPRVKDWKKLNAVTRGMSSFRRLHQQISEQTKTKRRSGGVSDGNGGPSRKGSRKLSRQGSGGVSDGNGGPSRQGSKKMSRQGSGGVCAGNGMPSRRESRQMSRQGSHGMSIGHGASGSEHGSRRASVARDRLTRQSLQFFFPCKIESNNLDLL